jgi:hypothetical protein
MIEGAVTCDEQLSAVYKPVDNLLVALPVIFASFRGCP